MAIMKNTIAGHWIATVISTVLIFQSSIVNSLPLPDGTLSSSTTSLPIDATQNRADEGVVLLVKDQTTQPAAAQPLENPSPKVRVLPPVETMLENEIWQYRYPPFDNLFDEKTNEDSDNDEATPSARSPRLNTDALPSYVIGILDPAELVDGLFQQRPFTFGLVRSQANAFNKRNSASNVDDAIRRQGKGVAESSQKIFDVPRIIIDSTSDDDRWVWQN
ncbi:uncharacterized protein LOC130690875 isoform X2 [Daphnia carinata]|uniref:uncharacterized protein LOC130690875 isoform X2 n=1 Tax=Daphnia carinata TaxID=120202 RepID=UPI00286919EF|nr:uncharacterized protein LOC130690875 isoform X2 [Daphnia carinata]